MRYKRDRVRVLPQLETHPIRKVGAVTWIKTTPPRARGTQAAAPSASASAG
jgi:hypothetical protein